MLRCFIFLSALTYCCAAHTQPRTDSLLLTLLRANPNPVLQQVMQQAAKYRCQVVYTRVDRDQHNRPAFTNYYFNYDPELYFYPASVVKLPLAALALEKLQTLRSKGIDRNTTLLFDSSHEGQKTLYTDSTAANGLPSIAQLIRRVLLISENDPYNRLYQFVGQQSINRSLRQKGYTSARISRQFMGFSEEQNRHTNQVRFVDSNGKLLYQQPPAYNTDSFTASPKAWIGKAYMSRNDSLVQAPFDFTRHNQLSLSDLQRMLQALLFPASVPARQRFGLAADDRRFLLQYLSQYPSETPYPKYDSTVFYDSYVKFFFHDSTHRMPAGVRVFNKVGWAYGFLTDVAYVADFERGVEYMLAATLYVNADEVLNDNKYEYETVGLPFFRALGQTIYEHELHRQRRYRPNLLNLRLSYEQRDPADTRPAIKEADN